MLLAFLFLGLPMVLKPGSQYAGVRPDPVIFIWSFAWWPHAILHGLNPFVTHGVWAPDGVNLTWSTTVPGLALLFAPLTLLAGPVAAFNTAAVLMPALAAWTAFLLCRYLTGDVWAALVGGYLFGFSSYVLEHEGDGGQLHLTAVALLPLITLVLLRFLDDQLTGRGLVVRLGPLLALQLLISTEVALTLSVAVTVALALCFLLVRERRQRILALLPALLGACVFAALLTAPFLYYLVTGFQGTAYFPPDSYVADPLNFLLPGPRALIGSGATAAFSKLAPGYRVEGEAYLGLPTLLIVGLFARQRLRTASGRLVLALLGAAIVVAMGAHATVAGHRLFALPWLLAQQLPGFDNVLTVRFAAYVSLVAGVVVALWTASRRAGLLRWLLPALAALAIVPNLNGAVWMTAYQVQPFFTDSSYRGCLDPGETILPLPIGQGEAMLWQALSQFRFKMAGGYVGPYIPQSFRTPSGIYYVTAGNHLGAAQTGSVRSFIAAKHVTSVVVDANEADFFAGALDPPRDPPERRRRRPLPPPRRPFCHPCHGARALADRDPNRPAKPATSTHVTARRAHRCQPGHPCPASQTHGGCSRRAGARTSTPDRR